jgi:hypothetical protein
MPVFTASLSLPGQFTGRCGRHLYVFQDGGLFSLASKPDPQHLKRLVLPVATQIEPAGTFTQPVHYKELFAGAGRKELLVFITDMYQQDGEISKLLDSLAALKHEIIVFQLMGKMNWILILKVTLHLEDLETGETIQVNTQRAKDAYTEKLQQHLAAIKSELLGKRIAYRMLSTAQPLDEALRDFLVQRKKGSVSFLNASWFFALAALSIPVLIHLWNIRPGKTLKVGSISLITEASKTTSRSLKLLDILLLILRCLLLALLAFFLAGPLCSYFSPDKKAKGWVLISKENFKESYQKFKPQVDSLRKAGYEFHYFNKGFAKPDWQKLLTDTARKDTFSQSNYWSLVKALDSKVRNSIGVYIITPNGANHFKGARPQTSLYLSWKTYIPADSTSRWIAAAWMGNGGEIKAALGNSTPSGTGFSTETVQADGNTDVVVNVQNGQPKVSLKNADQLSVVVDTSTLSIASLH